MLSLRGLVDWMGGRFGLMRAIVFRNAKRDSGLNQEANTPQIHPLPSSTKTASETTMIDTAYFAIDTIVDTALSILPTSFYVVADAVILAAIVLTFAH
ncbi:hypothetical protein [Paraburkholderia fungorum]|jgi:hypothetical protein|uniref:hypothetical protein n=1 Tax=Paraburkholderia fungorum TaxID=134537 RepID=UPI0011B1F45C|nr:hypothetical protein [Paraburkholderia fungorum]